MNKTIQWIIGAVAVVALLLSLNGLIGDNNQSGSGFLGGMTNLDGLTITPSLSTDGFKVGSNGSTNSELIAGTCTSFNGAGLNSIDGSQPASSTRPYDCAVTGVTSGDIVFAQFATSTSAQGAGYAPWIIAGAKASTTAGFITVLIFNPLPSATVPSSIGIGSSTNYWVVDTI